MKVLNSGSDEQTLSWWEVKSLLDKAHKNNNEYLSEANYSISDGDITVTKRGKRIIVERGKIKIQLSPVEIKEIVTFGFIPPKPYESFQGNFSTLLESFKSVFLATLNIQKEFLFSKVLSIFKTGVNLNFDKIEPQPKMGIKARLILRWCLPRNEYDEVLGDIEESYWKDCDDFGVRQANSLRNKTVAGMVASTLLRRCKGRGKIILGFIFGSLIGG